ncbi:(S)-1-Phenylethanol dehydrogenase [Baekduia alba]|uniref:SDR family oxidoreductase n=1 Tax=Baekduia alba TaxID=2997333 RepID=UPI002340CEE5|nr:SDR family oxidoreductase [Baekduia alba]WCB92276.1 (S)-1-Phenylethanol dehydrogenase [Baekduia alba]
MDLGIAGRCALVLGGGGGLGSAIATALADEGAIVAVADLSLPAAEATAARIVERGGAALPIGWDLADLDAFPALHADVAARLGAVDILVNNTGGPPPGPAAGVPAETWERHFRSMVLGVIAVTDLVLPDMRARGWGRVITSTSSGVVAPIPSLAISNALRMALVGWSKTLAGEVGGDGVTANVILPGRIATARIEQLDQARAEREATTVDAVRAASTGSIPLGRYGRPEEYGAAVAFLASAAASYLTGSIVRVDGGLIPSI